jgi:hypothetical protein
MKKSKNQESVVPYVREEKSEAELLLMSINHELESRKRKCLAYQEKFDEDFINAFKFYGEDMCVQKIWVKQLGWMIRCINDGETIESMFTKYLNMYEGHLKQSYNVRLNSTSALARELSIYEFQTYMELRSYLLNLQKSYPKAF